MKKIKPYLIEFTIVTAGVLLALFLNNLKESNHARKYHIASMRTINMEVLDNYSNLKGVIEKQTNLLDSLTKYTESSRTLLNLFQEKGGLTIATVSNAGLDFYKKDQINSIDFKMMSKLILMNYLSGMIDTKIEKLSDFIYPNMFNNSKESKQMVSFYLKDVLGTENQLITTYEDFIKEYVEN
ncbi:hypothetical protein ACE1ET_19490 [Saccharicrinis sp. FJH62]|uniref:hypothetical protein n=1 Tax=Saccharicrinis sp. FJH62 TaxID=3344657 RepID=UPI0035D3DFF7